MGRLYIAFLILLQVSYYNPYYKLNNQYNYKTETQYEYGEDGRIEKVCHEDGTVEIYEYDKNGNLINVIIEKQSNDQAATSTTESNNYSTEENDFTQSTQISEDTNTEESTQNTSQSKNNGTSHTGDTSSLFLSGLICLMSLAGMILILINKERK